MNPKDRLTYALYLQRLHEIFVLKDNIAFQYPNAHYNKAAARIDKVVDKCLDNNIRAVVDGTYNLETPNLDNVISEALQSQQRMLIRTEDRYIQQAVEQNTKDFTRFIQNRIEKENTSLQSKILEEYEKQKYRRISSEEAKKRLSEKFSDSARKRSKNIVKDALHTNQSRVSWVYNVNNGMRYKVWMNGQGKGRVRVWHRSRLIQPVPVEDYFDIYGSYHARMMYPGDLAGGAENVANCRCWLRYTDQVPSDLKKRGTLQINSNMIGVNDNPVTYNGTNTKSGSETDKEKNTGLLKRIRNRVRDVVNRVKVKI